MDGHNLGGRSETVSDGVSSLQVLASKSAGLFEPESNQPSAL